MRGEVTEARPPHRLAWTFAGDDYSFELAQHEDGCRLVFIHVFDDRSTGAQTAAGWHSYFSRLQRHLAGDDLSEHAAHHGWAEVHERYAEAFGLDPAPGRRFAEQLRADHA